MKFKLDRRSLETMYFSFVQPTMIYGCVVWGGSCDTAIAKIEKIHIDGMRLVTGATSHSNIHRLYAETGWVRIQTHIDMAMVIMLFKIKHRQVPNYLFGLLPENIAESIDYNLRNDNNIRVPFSRKEAFRRSFFPSAIRLWNKLILCKRNASSLSVLKSLLKKDSPEKKIIYFYGKRWPSIHHAQLRMQCSKLNYDLCCKLYVLDSPACRCGAPRETASHYFFDCPRYVNIHTDLLNEINKHTTCNIDTILLKFFFYFIVLSHKYNPCCYN